MANTVTNYLPKLLAMGQRALRENAIMTRLVSTDLQSLAASQGDVINVPVPSAISARTVTPAVTFAANQDFNPTNVAVTLDFWREATFQLSDQDIQEIAEGTIPMQASEAVKSLANAVDDYILGKHTGFFGAAGVAGTTPFASSMQAAATARRLLNRQLSPLTGDRAAVLDPDAEAALLAVSNVLQFDQRGSDEGIVNGSIGRKLGFDWHLDQNIPTFTPGSAWTSGIIAASFSGAIGDTTLRVISASASGAIKVGDIFKLTADTAENQYVITADTTISLTVAVVLSFFPGLKTLVLTDATLIVVSVAYQANIAFSRNALAWASRPLADIDGHGNSMLSAVDPVSGIALRLEISRQYKQTTFSYDVLGGAAVIRPEYGVKIFG